MRKTYSGDLKSKILLEIFKEEKTLSQIASEYEVHTNQLKQWRKIALESLPLILEDGRKKGDKEIQEYKKQIQELYSEIGELTTKLNWLKKKSGIKFE
jgi:putative transposase